MDKKIKKVKKIMDKKLNGLVKEDIPRDKKLKECAHEEHGMKMKHKKK